MDIQKINAYLKWVEIFNKDILDEAIKNGFIDTIPNTEAKNDNAH